MSTPDAVRAMIDRRHRHVSGGLQVTLRRRATLRHRVTQVAITSLTLATAAAGGASAIDLVASNLTGELPAGSQVTIAAVVYTTTTFGKTNSAGQLLALGISPVLAAPAAQGAAATVTRAWSEQIYNAMRSELVGEGLDGWVEGATKSYRLSAVNGARAPEEQDLVYDGTERDAVKRVRTLEPGVGGAIGWLVWVGIGT